MKDLKQYLSRFVFIKKNKMSLSVKGTLTRKLEIESGTSKEVMNGKQSFLIDTGNQYNQKYVFNFLEKILICSIIMMKSKVEVSFNLSSREYNGRYFHNIDAWRIESIEKSEEKSEDIPEFVQLMMKTIYPFKKM